MRILRRFLARVKNFAMGQRSRVQQVIRGVVLIHLGVISSRIALCVALALDPRANMIPENTKEASGLRSSSGKGEERVVCSPQSVRSSRRIVTSPGFRPSPITSITVSKQELYSFFRELAQPFDPNKPPVPPNPEATQQLFQVTEKYKYWLGSPDENAAIGISLR
jgi:hypothetical protein